LVFVAYYFKRRISVPAAAEAATGIMLEMLLRFDREHIRALPRVRLVSILRAHRCVLEETTY